MEKYYFYNGFGKPSEISIEEMTLNLSYKGDMTEVFKEHHEAIKDWNDEDYNSEMFEFGIYRNPSLEELQEANRHFGLDEDTYLEDFI